MQPIKAIETGILDSLSLDGHVAIVTGSGNGINQAMALDLAGAGTKVVVVDREFSIVKPTAEAIETKGRQTLPLAVDVLDADQVSAMIDQVMKAFGKIDILINNVGGTGRSRRTLINITNLRRMIDVPVIAAGGIGDARAFMAALAMGASAVYMGTAFMAAREFRIAQKAKKAISDQSVLDIAYSKKIYQSLRSGTHSLASGGDR